MYLDIALLVVVVLFGLVGLAKGFYKSVIGLIGGLLSLLIAIMLADKVADSLLGVESIHNMVFGENSIMSAVIKLMPAKLNEIPITADPNTTQEAMTSTFLSPFIGSIQSYVESVAGNFAEGEIPSMAEGLSILVSRYIFTLLCGIILYIAARILLMFLTMFLNSLTKDKFVNGINRFLGFLVGLGKGAVLIFVFFFVINCFSGMEFVEPVMKQIDESTVARPVATQVSQLSNKYFNKAESKLKDLMVQMGLIKLTGMTTQQQSVSNKLTVVNQYVTDLSTNYAKYATADVPDEAVILNSAGDAVRLHDLHDQIGTLLTQIKAKSDALSQDFEQNRGANMDLEQMDSILYELINDPNMGEIQIRTMLTEYNDAIESLKDAIDAQEPYGPYTVAVRNIAQDDNNEGLIPALQSLLNKLNQIQSATVETDPAE